MGFIVDEIPIPLISSKRLRRFRYFVLFHICASLLYEIICTYLITQAYRQDIYSYDKDRIWIRETFKATRNLFIFTAILAFLVLSIGLVGVFKDSRILVMIFLVMHVLVWGFELIGVYMSNDYNVFIYKAICELTKPSLFLVALIYWWIMKEIEH